MYNWQHPQWPHFHYDLSKLQEILYHYAVEASALKGSIMQISEALQQEAYIDLMVKEALKTSEIEGEIIKPEDVRSSLQQQMGFYGPERKVKDARASGIASLMLSVRQTFRDPLTKEMLCEWHRMIFPDPSVKERLNVGKWRTNKDPMQIVSGALGREIVHFEAPPSHLVKKEMRGFIKWFKQTGPTEQDRKCIGPVRAAVAHLYFESIHPFEDGNGRIGRAISEKALAQDLNHPALLSLSSLIQKKRNKYYKELSLASRGDLDITRWVSYFVGLILEAQLEAKEVIHFVLKKAHFWKKYESVLNERQIKMIQRVFKEGYEGFKGGISAKKYMAITGCSKATATRDLADMLRKECLLLLEGRGRSTFYEINLRG